MIIEALEFYARPMVIQGDYLFKGPLKQFDRLFSLPILNGITLDKRENHYNIINEFYDPRRILHTAARITIIAAIVILTGAACVKVIAIGLLGKALLRGYIYAHIRGQDNARPYAIVFPNQALTHHYSWAKRFSLDTQLLMYALGADLITEEQDEEKILVCQGDSSAEFPISFINSIPFLSRKLGFNGTDVSSVGQQKIITLDTKSYICIEVLQFLKRVFSLDVTLSKEEIPEELDATALDFLCLSCTTVEFVLNKIIDEATSIADLERLEQGGLPAFLHGRASSSIPTYSPSVVIPALSLSNLPLFSKDEYCSFTKSFMEIKEIDSAIIELNEFLCNITHQDMPTFEKHFAINRFFELALEMLLNYEQPTKAADSLKQLFKLGGAHWGKYITVMAISTSIDYRVFSEITMYLENLRFLCYYFTPSKGLEDTALLDWIDSWSHTLPRLKILDIDGIGPSSLEAARINAEVRGKFSHLHDLILVVH